MRASAQTLRTAIGAGILFITIANASAGEVRVAVAANFAATLQQLKPEFEATTGHSLTISSGSTGRHYAQILNGAPFDVFLAADTDRPQRLLAAGDAEEQFNYAAGRLFLWANKPAGDAQLRDWLASAEFGRLAIANSRLAPYGLAAMQTLRALGLEEQLRARLVTGENVAQCFQFVASGNAGAGFVAYAQIKSAGINAASGWLVPAELHDPVIQGGVRLTDTPGARAFVVFLRGERARAMIVANGYQLPSD